APDEQTASQVRLRNSERRRANVPLAQTVAERLPLCGGNRKLSSRCGAPSRAGLIGFGVYCSGFFISRASAIQRANEEPTASKNCACVRISPTFSRGLKL